MNCLTLIEPWASMVAYLLKLVETRSWYTPYRGPIAIHASKSIEVVKHPAMVRQLFDDALLIPPATFPDRREAYPLGKVIAVGRLVNCTKMTEKLVEMQTRQERAFGAWAPGRFAWFLADVKRLAEPIPCRGALGIWKAPPEVEAAVRRQTEAA